jgi:hypothetical protein
MDHGCTKAVNVKWFGRNLLNALGRGLSHVYRGTKGYIQSYRYIYRIYSLTKANGFTGQVT